MLYPGAGFYLDATHSKYAQHYNMLTHVTLELPAVLEQSGLPIVRPEYSYIFTRIYSSDYLPR